MDGLRKKKIVIAIVLLCVAIVTIMVCFHNIEQRHKKNTYVEWAEEKCETVCYNNADCVIAYVNQTPIHSKDLQIYMIESSIDRNYFQKCSLDTCYQSESVIEDSFERLVLDCFYCQWSENENLKSDEELKNEVEQILKIEAESDAVNIAACAQVKLNLREPFSLWFEAQYARDMIEQKYYPYHAKSADEVGQYQFEVLYRNASKTQIYINENAPECLKSDELCKRLEEYGFDVLIPNP